VCYRVRSGKIEFLLVRTRSGKRWIFPKGSAERGLSHAQAAALEAFEEAGVHGRIEEAAFARYRRLAGDDTGGSQPAKNSRINAHLCEVLRLSAAKESGRERTWFSAGHAKDHLREGRTRKQASEFIRVIDRAVDRIEQLFEACEDKGSFADMSVCAPLQVADRSVRATRFVRATRSQGRDALQQVKFDFSEICGSLQNVSFGADHSRGKLEQDRSLMPRSRQRENLPCEILEFETPGKLKLPN